MGKTIADAAYMETEELRAIQRGLDRLTAKLLPAIEAGEFGIVIGDDTTGRLPARFIHAFINNWNAAHGRPKIPLVFIQGTSSKAQQTQLQQQLERRAHLLDKRLPDRRALVVTEGITSGGSIARLGQELTARDIAFDVAVLDGGNFTRTPDASQQPASRDAIDAFATLLESAQIPVNIPFDAQIEFWNTVAGAEVSDADWECFNTAFEKGDVTSELLASIAPLPTRTQGTTRGTTMAQRLVLAVNSQRSEPMAIQAFITQLRASDLPAIVFKSMRDNWLSIVTTDTVLHANGIKLLQIHGTSRQTAEPTNPLDAVGWPTATRLFRGKQNAGPIRDRPDLTGLVLEKFTDTPCYRGNPEDRARRAMVRQDLCRYAQWSCQRLGFSSEAIPLLLPHLSSVLQQLVPALEEDGYAFILGQNPGGRLPAELIGKAINTWRDVNGKSPLPIVFLDGNTIPHSPAQVAAAKQLAHRLPPEAAGRRALILADPVDNGNSVPSIVERMNDIGYDSDLVYLFGMSEDAIASYLKGGHIRPKTRIVSSRQAIDKRAYQECIPAYAAQGGAIRDAAHGKRSSVAAAATAQESDITTGAKLLAGELS